MMKRRSFFRTIIGTCIAISAAGRMALQPELKPHELNPYALTNKDVDALYEMIVHGRVGFRLIEKDGIPSHWEVVKAKDLPVWPHN